MSKKSTLRSVLGAINKPVIKLSKDQTFAPPPLENVPLPTQPEPQPYEDQPLHPEDEKSTVGAIKTQDQNISQGEKETYPMGTKVTHPVDENKAYPSDTNVTLDQELSSDLKQTPDQKITYPMGVEITHPVDQNGAYPSGINITQDQAITSDEKTTQDEKVTYPAESRLTKSEKTANTLEKLRKGFTRIPNSILMEMVYGCPSKAEMKILLLIARYTISFDERRTAALSKADIERYTQLQGKSILESLASLEQKKLIIKIKGDQYTSNQLGLVYEQGVPPQGIRNKLQSTASSSTGNTKGPEKDPQVKNTPQGEKGTHFKESFSKNSFKESLSSDFNFPDDLKARWSAFEKLGKFQNSKKEREIFQNLFSNHEKQIFDYCGKVIAFLEDQGTGKPGEEGKIHSPMVWIDGHWDLNFSRYQNWIEKQRAREAEQIKSSEIEL